MLSDEHRMPSHWRLFTIILWKIRGNSGIYKLICVLFDGFKTFGGYVISVFLGKLEFGSEFGLFEGGKLLRYG
jgi:hypothetical protein